MVYKLIIPIVFNYQHSTLILMCCPRSKRYVNVLSSHHETLNILTSASRTLSQIDPVYCSLISPLSEQKGKKKLKKKTIV